MRSWGSAVLSLSLLVLTVITVTRAQTQYFDFLQGLQQLFQPYLSNENVNLFNGATRAPHKQTNRQENKKKTVKNRHRTEGRRTKTPPPTNQYDDVFATTEKPSRKTTKSNSSKNNNSSTFNNMNEQSNILFGQYPYEITTKVNRVETTTTTEASYFNYDGNRETTQNVFSNNSNVARPVITENVNHRETFVVNNQPRPANMISNGASLDSNNSFADNTNNRPQNDQNSNSNVSTNNRGSENAEKNLSLTENNRNNNGFLNTDNNPGFNNFGNTGVGFNNTGTTNNTYNTRGNSNNNTNNSNNDSNNNSINNSTNNSNNNSNNNSINNSTNNSNNNSNKNSANNSTNNSNNNSNNNSTNNSNNNSTSVSDNNATNNSNNLNQGNNFGGFNYSDTPLINQPKVQPSPVDVGVPPITNRPASNNNNFGEFNRPSDPSSGTLTDQTDQKPEILIGPNEDDMTESQKKQYVEKAERMCDYYKSFAEKKALSRILSPEPRGIKASVCAPINVPLVIGGSVASIREFPHMALVGWLKLMDEGYSWKCGGSLISDRYVLTAAHCTYVPHKDTLEFVSGPPRAVQLGSSYRDDREALVVKISATIRHPKFDLKVAYHDVGLIKMVSKVKFSEVIRPACLGVPPPTDTGIYATGWGKTETRGDPSVQLRSVSLSVWDMQDCQKIYGKPRQIPNGVLPDSHLCAGDKGGWHDTCQGDSGGPVQIQEDCLWRVFAVTSLGRRICGFPDFPALYAVIPHAFVAAQVFDEVSLQ